MQVLNLFAVASMPVLKVLLVTALGLFLALDNINLLGPQARHHINQLVFYVLNPSLVGSNLAKTVTYQSFLLLWFMPFNVLITFILGSALGWLLIKLTNPPQNLKGLILGCCAAGNLGNLPLIIIPAICKEKGSPLGDPDTCHTYGLAYASLSMALGAIFLWSYVYNIMRISAKQIQETEGIPKQDNNNNHHNDYLSDDLTHGLLNSESHKSSGTSLLEKMKQWLWMVSAKLNLKAVFAPSTIGAISGFVIGLVPQIRNILIGSTAPLHVVEDSASFIGDSAIPIVTLILGANLLKGLRGSGIGISVMIGILVVRYILLPLCGIVIVKTAIHIGVVGADPSYQFILLLQFALPPAMNIGTMSQLFGSGQSECSVIMLWTYALASVALTLWSTLFLWMVA
ncbi:Auxin efflux carrier family protein [Euphorbia peplus]|nr:Auxin efflux carrier family protein [Euphorbia peplus]